MNVLFVVAEMAPLVKVGGLGDVGGALPRALRDLGVDVRVAMPLYKSIDRGRAERQCELAGGTALWTMEVEGVPVYCIEHDPSFARDNVYAYDDDLDRFLIFSDALLAAAETLDWTPDVIHLNDWHPGAIAMRLANAPEHPWSRAALVCTVHNVAFAGPFDEAFALRNGLEVRDDALSMLGQALLRADAVTTASPTHAKELLKSEIAGDIAELLAAKDEPVVGILNGLDTDAFDPTTDALLAAAFDADRLDRRGENKRALQRNVGLPEDADVPLIGMVSRFFWQKGIDIAAGAIDSVLEGRAAQFVALGRGDEENEQALMELAERHPERVAVRLAFDEPLSRLIYGGSDMFLMPSRYEPGGIGQLIAMRYGSVPVVRRTGGLADSVEQYQAPDTGTGFLFDDATGTAAADALEQAIDVYEDRGAWRGLQRRGMRRDCSWAATAREYADVYERAVTHRAALASIGER